MPERAKKAEQLSPGCDDGDATTSCYPALRRWWQPGWPWSCPDLGLQPVLELQGNLPQRGGWFGPGCSPWRGYYAPLSVPSCCVVGAVQSSSPDAACSTERYTWRVILDMTHFAPSEISVSVQEGLLVVGGSHSERPDVFGFTARCFTRKYRLPVGIDVSKLTSAMSGDGILCVEAPLPDTYSIPADIAIPIQVEKETIGGHEEATPETHAENGEPQQSEPTAPEQPPTKPEPPSTEAPDHGEEDTPLAGDDNKQEEEEVQEAEVNGTTPSGEPHPLAPADEEGTERFPEPSEHSEAPDDRDDTASSIMEQQTQEPGNEETLETDAESRETLQTTAPAPSDQQAAAPAPSDQQAAAPAPSDQQPTAPAPSDQQPTAPAPSDQQAAAPAPSDQQAAAEDLHGSTAGDLQEHEEGTEEAEPHPALTPAASHGGTAESLPDPPPPPPEHREALEGQDSPAAASAEPAHDGEMQPGEEEAATEEITQQQQQHEEPELVKGLPSDGLSQELLDLAAPDVKQ